MINNMILTMQSTMQLTKNGEKSVNGSKYKSSQVSDFRNIMAEAKNNIKSNVSEKVYKKQEDFVRDDDKFNSVGKERALNDTNIKNNKLEENQEVKINKVIEEPIDEEEAKMNDKNIDDKTQLENILNLVNTILKEINTTNQESNRTISDQQITEISSLLDKAKFSEDSNNLLSTIELDNIINKLKEALLTVATGSRDLEEVNSSIELQLELQNLLKMIDKKGTKENEMANLMQTDIEVKEDSSINTEHQDLVNIVNSKRPGNNESSNEGIDVKSTKETIHSGNENEEKIDEKVQVSEKTDTGKLIQKVMQKVIIEPKDSLNADVKLDNIVKNAIDKVNLVDKPTPLYKMEVLKQIVDKAQVLLGNDTSEMDMQLRPENLGKLSLKVVIEKGLMSARFIAESQQVKEIIESNFNQLKDMLQQKGIDIQNFSVSVGQQNKNFNDNNGYRAWKDSLSSSTRSKISMDFEDDMTGLLVESKNPYEYHEGSVDYKA